MIKIIERRICLEPRFLDQNIYSHLLKKIKDSIEGECTKEHGHILKINKLVKIYDNMISSANSDIVFTVLFEAETLKPEIGYNLSGNVCMILPSGIFVNIQDKLKVLIPRNELNDYIYNASNTCYNKNDISIKNGDIVTVCISGIRYTKQNFSCFGSLIHE